MQTNGGPPTVRAAGCLSGDGVRVMVTRQREATWQRQPRRPARPPHVRPGGAYILAQAEHLPPLQR